jgi:hypothetical protein
MAEKKRGRPRKHADGAERLRRFRKEQHRRLDGYIDSQASWRLNALAAAWGCSRGKVLERLLLEADDKYEDVLFPETKNESENAVRQNDGNQ